MGTRLAPADVGGDSGRENILSEGWQQEQPPKKEGKGQQR